MADRTGALALARRSPAGMLLATLLVFTAAQAVGTADASTRARGRAVHARERAPQSPGRTVRFAGKAVDVPAGWPVYRLSAHPRMCVRLDRKAVYLGRPGSTQRCPADAIGRRRAILVEPRLAGAARLHARSTGGSAPPTAGISVASEFTGLGFDACTAPSSRSMAAWGASPYRAIGVYIGGSNRGCSQPNLTSSWVIEQISNGWHLIPTYVGLQSPTSSCSSCAKINPGAAASQGTAAASDAVEEARLVGLGPGTPIYFDMESYERTTASTSATLTFLSAWTTHLHALGYISGVYSSSSSGIVDLVGAFGSGYPEPDDLWIANWNGRPSTSDSAVPSYTWSQHQRIHQYAGGHSETYGGVTINIDNDYVEGATAGTAESAADPKGALSLAESPRPGWVRIAGWAFDPEAPTEPLSITAYVGGKAGEHGAVPYDLGPAGQERQDIAASHTSAGANHGFDTSFATWKTGRQPVCVYAANLGAGSDKLLGCRTIGVPVAVVVSHLHGVRNAIRAWTTCEWPDGTACPGQFLLRAHVRVRTRHRGRRGPRTRVVRVALARHPFTLGGEQSHGFRIPLTRRGRELLAGRTKLWAQLVVAIPGGRLTRAVELKPRYG